jgi:putative ABC transport system permease protein
MIKRFLTFTFRYFRRNKSYSILNFLCLTFGLTCAIIALLYILNILSYDKFHKNYDRLFEVEARVTFFNGDSFLKEPLSASLGEVLLNNIPEIESLSRIVSRNHTVVYGEKFFSESGIYADENFFNLFSFPVLSAGSPDILSDINSIVISERMAKKLFVTTDCRGKMLVLDVEGKKEAIKIAGVFKDVPAQSLLQFDFIIPFSRFLSENSWANDAGASANQVWILLKKNVNAGSITPRIKNLIKNQEQTLNQELFLFPLKEKMLYSYAGGKRVWKEMQWVVVVGAIGFAILLIACFNFINLSIAMNLRRNREIALKKVAGAGKPAIILQFLGETFVLVLISLVFAIIFSKLLLYGFNTIFDANIHLGFTNLKVILFIALIALTAGLLSGLLPSVYLASFNPVAILKAKILNSGSYSSLRLGLIIFQFVIPIVLIIFMMIIKDQQNYMKKFDLGFDRDKLIVLKNTKNLEAHEESLKADLYSVPGIEAVSFTNCIPARGTRVSNEVSWEGKDPTQKLHFWCVNSDFDYAKTIQIKMTAGRYFDRSFTSDSSAYLINDIAAGIMKNSNPLGSSLTLEGKKGTIIGVFSDFHSVDLRGPLTPMIISLKRDGRNTLLVRFSSGSYSEMKGKLGLIYKRYDPENSYQPVLYNDLPDFAGLKMTSNLVGLAFSIALILACMGLSGLASYTAERRTKEIGIRKTSGATIFSIMQLLLKSYTRWLTVAFLIAVPVAFLFGKLFLARFYFRTPMPYWAFIAGPSIAYIVALCTVAWQSRRAANRNPVESLKYE